MWAFQLHGQLKWSTLALTFIFLLSASATIEAKTSVDSKPRTLLTIPVAVYLVASNDGLSSHRTVESMEAHFEAVNRIWRQADISIQPVVTEQIQVPGHLLSAVSHRRGRGGISDFFSAIRHGKIVLNNTSSDARLYAFYMHSLGGPNGLKPIGANVIFVADNTSVAGPRVSSHEIGHVLGLYHVHTDANRLLYSGTEGVMLSEEEQAVARYNAKRILRQF